MEHETPVPDVVEKPRVRAVDPAVAAAEHEVSPAEQNAVRPATAAPAAALRRSVVMGLQRTAGNAAVAGLLQRRLANVDDQETEEADVLSPVLDVVGKGRGQPLDPDLQEEMEARIGHDFSDVRVHTDTEAAKSAAAVSARAYTVGSEVVLGSDSPTLDTDQGKRTLAHELTHVVQQRTGPVEGTPTGDGISISDPADRFEQAAEANAARVMSEPGGDAHVGGPGRPQAQRDVTTEAEEEQEQVMREEPAREEPALEEPADEEPVDALPVQGRWVQRAPATTDTVGDEEDEEAYELGDEEAYEPGDEETYEPGDDETYEPGSEEAYEAEAEAGEQEVETEIAAADQEVEEDQAEGEAEDQAAEAEMEEEAAQAEADNERAEAAEEETESVQGIWLQREPAEGDGDAGAPAADAAAGPSVDDFDAMFKSDAIVSELAEEGAGDLAAVDADSESGAPTAQALFLQRDPPAPAAAPAAPAPAPQPAAAGPAAAPTVQPGNAGAVLAALAAVPEFKLALDQVKAQAATDWKQIVAGTTPAEKVIIFTVAGTIVGGGAAGAMSNKSSRSFMLDKVNDQKIDIPGLSGLSVTPKTANGSFQGGVVTLDVYKMFPQLQKAVPGVTN